MLYFRSEAIANYLTFRNNLGKLATSGLAGSVHEVEFSVSLVLTTQFFKQLKSPAKFTSHEFS